MGFLGLCLLFTGMALVKGTAAIPKRGAAFTVFINRAPGRVLSVGNFARFVGAGAPLPVCSAAGGRR